MAAYKSTTDAVVDLFYAIGASRGKDILPQFTAALASDLDAAIRVALWTRDVREGAGERQLFRDILRYLAFNDYKVAQKLIPFVPELGRWDDLLVLVDSPVWNEAANFIRQGLFVHQNGLCAKWMPRKGPIAVRLRDALGLSPKSYRKTLVALSDTVETDMCAKEWGKINYSHVPSVASARYQRAFGRNDQNRYAQYLNSLVKKEKGVKINAGAVYPYDIVQSLTRGNAAVANEQWKALPDFVQKGMDFLPVIDVSGSMGSLVPGTKVSCMDVAVSLGLYLSEKCDGQFKDTFITFSEKPSLIKVNGSLENRVNQIRRSQWGYNTNLEAVFYLVLTAAVKFNLKQEDLPEYIIILSDMQFDAATVQGAGAHHGRVNTVVSKNITAHKMIKQTFAKAGLNAPTLVYWNLNAAYGNTPVKANEEGALLVSGFSPSLMKSLIGGKTVTPRQMVMEVIGKERYNWNK
jgi:hypothetical protein